MPADGCCVGANGAPKGVWRGDLLGHNHPSLRGAELSIPYCHRQRRQFSPTRFICRGRRHGLFQQRSAVDKRYSLAIGEPMSNPEGTQKLQSGMPSLADLDASLRSKRFLSNVLGINSPPTSRGKQLANGFVHLVQKALIEYEALRTKLTAFLENGVAEDFHRAQDHAETCVNALHRGIEYLDRLRSFGFRRADGSPYVPRARELAVLREDRRRAVRRMRDLLEHIDADIIGGRVDPGGDVTVRPTFESLRLGSAVLSYAQMADNIRLLHSFAVELSEVRITVSGAPPSSTSG